MINAEKYRDEILAVTNKHEYFALKADNPTVITRCNDVEQCRGCLFDNGTCSSEKMKWLLSEYKEPIKLSKVEYELLKFWNDEEFKYIARDSGGTVFIYNEKPSKKTEVWGSIYGHRILDDFEDLFQFVKFEDEEPTPIKKVLDNCEVIENESK